MQMNLIESDVSVQNWLDATKPIYRFDVLALTIWFTFFGLVPAVVACFYQYTAEEGK